jgi:predicted Zn-dependent protease
MCRQAAFLAGVLMLCVLSPMRAAADDAKLQQARELIGAGRAAEAVPIYQQLLDASPKDPSLVMNLAIALFQAGEFEQAAEHCRAALSLRPGWGGPLLFLGASYLRLGEAAAAVKFLEQAAAAQPEERNTRLMLGEALLQTDDPAEAIPHLEKASALLPGNPRVWYGLSRSYSLLAQKNLGEVESAARESAYWHALAGDDLFRRERLGRALHHYREALALRPEMLHLHQSIAALYERAGKSDWAAAELRKAPTDRADCDAADVACWYRAEKFPETLAAARSLKPPAATYWRAKAYSRLAETASDRLSQLPASPQLHELAARSLADRAMFQAAAKRWREALALDPKSVNLKLGLAVSLRGARDHRAALELLAELLEQQPDRSDVAYLYGDSLVETGSPAEAVRFLKAVVDTDPDLLAAQASLGRAYSLLGEANLAIPHLQAASPMDEDGSIHYQLAMAYRDAGEQQLSRQQLTRYESIRAEAAARLRELDAEVPVTGP